MNEPIKKEDLVNLYLSRLPDGPTNIIDGGRIAAVLMTIEYYEYLENLVFELRDRLDKIK